MKPSIAITMGDAAGIGPEICLDALASNVVTEICNPIVFGDLSVLTRCAAQLDLRLPPRAMTQKEWLGGAGAVTGPTVLDFDCLDATEVEPGSCNSATGRAAFRYIEAAVKAALAHHVDAVVTGPVQKGALHAAGFPYPGHTEYFAAQTGTARSCMMLTSPEITCSLVTAHVGFRDIAKLLSVERIVEVIELSHVALARMLGRPPRLTVCGLNPHAGENGLFGAGEEEEFIQPAIDATAAMGLDVVGPLPPDTAFLPARRRATDGYICMYHDQALIPLKALAFDSAVNVTLGLPIVRTSVDHGTALDIAWQNQADSTSLIRAIELAVRLANPNTGRGMISNGMKPQIRGAIA